MPITFATAGEASSARSAAMPMSPVGPVTATVRSEAEAPATISAGEDRPGGPVGQLHGREHRVRPRGGRERTGVADPDAAGVVELAPWTRHRARRVGTHPAGPHLVGAEEADLAVGDRQVPYRGDERCEVLATPPDRCEAAQRLHLLDPARLHDPRHLGDAPMQVRDIELVADRVVEDRPPP